MFAIPLTVTFIILGLLVAVYLFEQSLKYPPHSSDLTP